MASQRPVQNSEGANPEMPRIPSKREAPSWYPDEGDET